MQSNGKRPPMSAFGSTCFKDSVVVKLNSWKEGRVAEGVAIKLKDGRRLIALIVEDLYDQIVLRCVDEVLPRRVWKQDIALLEHIAEQTLPDLCFRMETKEGLGGLGTHQRRVMYPDSEEDTVGGFIGNADDRFDELQRLAETISGFELFIDNNSEQQVGLVPCLLPGPMVPHITLTLAMQDFVITLPNVRKASLHADSLARAPHLYAQQLKFVPLAEVGCTRGIWRYRFGHLPPGCNVKTPFSWPAWGKYVADQLEADKTTRRVNELEQPLRAYVISELRERQSTRMNSLFSRLNDTQYRYSKLRHLHRNLVFDSSQLVKVQHSYLHTAIERRILTAEVNLVFAESQRISSELLAVSRERSQVQRSIIAQRELQGVIDTNDEQQDTYFVTKPLSTGQSLDAMDAFHGFYYASHLLSEDEREVKRAKLQHLPQTTGHFVHWTSAYDNTNDNVGNGEFPRYAVDLETLPAKARNKLTVDSNGTFRGKGGMGYKGRFKRKDAYNPQKQLVLTNEQYLRLQSHPTAIL